MNRIRFDSRIKQGIRLVVGLSMTQKLLPFILLRSRYRVGFIRLIATSHKLVFEGVRVALGISSKRIVGSVNRKRGNGRLRRSLVSVRPACIKGAIVMKPTRSIESRNIEFVNGVQGSLFFGRLGAVGARSAFTV